MPIRIGTEETYRCPHRVILDDPQFWADLTYFYGFYRRNLMPDEGAIVRQAHRGMRLMQLLDNAIGECEAVLRAK
jgi:hypothetical protein